MPEVHSISRRHAICNIRHLSASCTDTGSRHARSRFGITCIDASSCHTWAIFNSNTTIINRRITSRHALYIDITIQVKLDATAFSGGLNVITAFEAEYAAITDWFINGGTAIGSKVETSIDFVFVGFDIGGIGTDIRSIRYDISRVFGDVGSVGSVGCDTTTKIISYYIKLTTINSIFTIFCNISIHKIGNLSVISINTSYGDTRSTYNR